MSDPAACLLRAEGLSWSGAPGLQRLDLSLPPGLTLVCGGEGRGKSALLALLAGSLAPTGGTLWRAPGTVFLATPTDAALDAVVARDWLRAQQAQHPAWRAPTEQRLGEAMGLGEHLDKPLFMLSAGSRRKVGLLAAAASGATLTLIDQPYVALDARSCRLLDEVFAQAAEGAERAWVVADYERPAGWAGLALAACVDLGD